MHRPPRALSLALGSTVFAARGAPTGSSVGASSKGAKTPPYAPQGSNWASLIRVRTSGSPSQVGLSGAKSPTLEHSALLDALNEIAGALSS